MANKNKLEQQENKNDKTSKLVSIIQKAIDANAFPGCVISINKGIEEEALFFKSFGNRSVLLDGEVNALPMNNEMIFDIGEITTLFCTSSLLMKLVAEEKCEVNDLVSRYLQGFSVNGKSLISIRNILTSQSGMISNYPFYEEIYENSLGSRIGMLASRGAKEYVLNYIVRSNLKSTPNNKVYYSEVAILLLGFLVEALSGNSLDKAFFKEIASPLGLTNTGFVDLTLLRSKKFSPITELIAPTENCVWREKLLCGEVENDNAWAIGGIAGNAGLFSSAREVSIFAKEILRSLKNESEIFRSDIVSEFLGLGEKEIPYLWERANKENGMHACGFSKKAVGVNAFTGCSLWIDPEKDLSIVFLSNRTNPSRTNKKISSYRAQIFTEALRLAES